MTPQTEVTLWIVSGYRRRAITYQEAVGRIEAPNEESALAQALAQWGHIYKDIEVTRVPT